MKKKTDNLKINFQFDEEYKTFKIEDLNIDKQISIAKQNWENNRCKNTLSHK